MDSAACRPIHLAWNIVEWQDVVSTTVNCWIMCIKIRNFIAS
jgi:hypothetical protein